MRHPTCKIIRTDTGHHARIDQSGAKVLYTEPYTRRRGALNALRIAAQAFNPTAIVTAERDAVVIDNRQGVGGIRRVPILDVDERLHKAARPDLPKPGSL
jgi:hypothetical protein